MVEISKEELERRGEDLFEEMVKWIFDRDENNNSLVIAYACFKTIHLMYRLSIDMNPIEGFDKEFDDIEKNAKEIVRTLKEYKKCKDVEWAANK